jgi:hypothetical protein
MAFKKQGKGKITKLESLKLKETNLVKKSKVNAKSESDQKDVK